MDAEKRLEHLKEVVKQAGGIFVGLQKTEPPAAHPLVMFQSKITGSTYALWDDEFFTVNAVQDKIKTTDAMFGNRGFTT